MQNNRIGFRGSKLFGHLTRSASQALLLPLSPSLLYISSLMTAELVIPSQVENRSVLKDPKLQQPRSAEAVLVLPVSAIKQDIPVLYVTGGVLNATRTISNSSCDLVVDPSADNNSATAIADGMLAGSHSYGIVLIILVGDLISHNHVVGAQGDTRDGNMEDGQVWRGGYGVGIGNKLQWVGISSSKFWVCVMPRVKQLWTGACRVVVVVVSGGVTGLEVGRGI
jgi:hypothetical protein